MSEKDPFDLQSFLPYLLNQAAEESSLGFQRVYKDRYGMLRSEWRVLFHLGMFGQMTATEIGARAKLHKTKVSRAVQRLSERRFVRRARSEEDRRVEWLELSPAGQKAYEDLRSVAARYEAELQRKLSSEEVAALKRILPKLVSAGSGA
ncbi:MarR family transcriptional regulator [Shimia sp. R10_1]|uniref:MarR family winged helix-turn-helix transcriptional regulator n=1 Tax=Shimia sp. R10_1 TaxID=2821095 RepID=UPI001ADC478E|nr:MarR family transcriptional regulator [Shimia sp. R10_1]MBO9474577.1 MarR family transcriptional regulator [Shimia sp. R10_1]